MRSGGRLRQRSPLAWDVGPRATVLRCATVRGYHIGSMAGSFTTGVTMTRRLVAALCLVIIGSVACDEDRITGAVAHHYTLAAVMNTAGDPVAVPAAIPHPYSDDTLRVLTGAFTLGPGHSWRWQRTAELIYPDSRKPQELEASGSYAARREGGAIVLDLYPGQVIPANLTTIAVIRHDSLFYGAEIFARAE
jgi:hypothetical protein